MAEFKTIVEQASDNSWTAAVIGEHTVLGTGATRKEALDDLFRGVTALAEYLGEQDKPIS